MAYVMKYQAGGGGSCTNEIPVTLNATEVFVDPISLVTKTDAMKYCSPTPMEVGGKVVLQLPRLKRLCGTIPAFCGPGQCD
jgi:hypothetical protein